VGDGPARDELRGILEGAGSVIVAAQTAEEAASQLHGAAFQLAFIDLCLPGLNGLETLWQAVRPAPRMIVLSLDDTAEALLRALREGAYDYFARPFDRQLIVERVEQVLSSPVAEIEVLSARPDWLELAVPCQLAAAERASGFVGRMTAGLPEEIRDAVGSGVRELLFNAVEWGGKLDPGKKVRIACMRGSRMVLCRIADPGTGFHAEQVSHAAIGYPTGGAAEYDEVRQEKGMRPGGLGLTLVRALADELIFNEAGNEVLLVKYLP
jgi:CheY-like chemotaxis protein/anti-sigma regulatory factor (Ser/Thr protein kinase)